MEKIIWISKDDWNNIVERALNHLRSKTIDKPLVFALYSKRGTHWNIVGVKEIPTVTPKGKDAKGFFIYIYPGIKSKGFYPSSSSPERFCGTLVVGDKLELSLTDAYWMARDSMDFRIKMDKDSIGKLVYKVWIVDKYGSFHEGAINLTD
ncbi:MAG: hypothetical protein N3F64_07635 [Nitrososphaeria archaeon]|nr:hypothetical protein [Nitrososphaeria archaeon]